MNIEVMWTKGRDGYWQARIEWTKKNGQQAQRTIKTRNKLILTAVDDDDVLDWMLFAAHENDRVIDT